MNKTSMTFLAALAIGALSPSLAVAAPAAHPTKTTTAKKPIVKKKAAAKKVTCTYRVQKGKKVKVCK